MLRNRILLSVFSLLIYCALQAQGLTYHHDIKPIIDRHCKSCHRSGEIGPMPLTNYEEVAAYGKMIQFVTTSKLMPPWYADPTYRHFKNERVLSEEEIKMISDWVSTDMQEGATPYGQVMSSAVGVTVYPKPDLVLSMREAFEQYGIYMDQYQVFVIPTNLDEDQWVSGIEFVPGNKKIVRQVSISVSAAGEFDSLDRWDPRYGYYSFGGLGKMPELPFWYTWSPQQKPSYYDEGSGKFLPKGSELIVHTHYGPTGVPQKDSSFIRLYFSTEKIKRPIVTTPLINPANLTNDTFFIEANTTKAFHAEHELKQPIWLLSLTPQANLLCKSWEVFAKIPGDPVPVKLLKIKDWNFNWKETYHLESPLLLPEGTVIHAIAHYDNTVNNLCNPVDKPIDVRLGSHLLNELFYVHFEFIPQVN